MRKNQQFHNDKLKRERQGMRGAESNCHIQLQTEQLTVLTALVLICSTMVAPDFACTLKNASAVVRYRPSLEVQAACFMHAQVYLAGTSLGQELGSNDRVKIVCAPPRLPQPQRRVDDCAHSGRSELDWGNAARASRRFSSGVEMRRWSSRPLHPPLHCRRQGRDDCSAPAGRSATIEIFSIRLVATPCDCADIPPAQTSVRNGH